MKLATLYSRVKPGLEKAQKFSASEGFDVLTFYFGITLLVAGCFLVFGAAIALLTAGTLFVLSVKPIARWIK